jgi:hypothetical protein
MRVKAGRTPPLTLDEPALDAALRGIDAVLSAVP